MANINVLIPPGAVSSYMDKQPDENVANRLTNVNVIEQRI